MQLLRPILNGIFAPHSSCSGCFRPGTDSPPTLLQPAGRSRKSQPRRSPACSAYKSTLLRPTFLQPLHTGRTACGTSGKAAQRARSRPLGTRRGFPTAVSICLQTRVVAVCAWVEGLTGAAFGSGRTVDLHCGGLSPYITYAQRRNQAICCNVLPLAFPFQWSGWFSVRWHLDG
jgi:hypothetical protein